MPRLAASLSESQYGWIESESESRDVSMAQVIRDLIDAGRGSESPYDSLKPSESGGESSTESDVNHDLAGRVGELEERLEAIETAVADDSFKPPGAEAESGALSQGGTDRMEHPADGDETAGSDPDDPGTGGDAGAWPAVEDLPALHHHDEPADDLEAAARGALEDLEIPGRGEATEAVRREAVMWAWNYLREHRTRQSSEIGNATFGAYWSRDRLGYSASTSGPYAAYGLWDSYLRDALKELPHVEAPPERGSTWRFVGDESDRKSEAEQFIVVQETE